MVPVIAPLLLALLLPRPALLTPAASTGLQLRGQRSPRDTQQDSIKVIISDGCSSPGDSSDSSQAGKEIDLSPGSPLVLTHKIKLVSSGLGTGSGSGSCSCEADFAALRERVENLEREVSALREKCGGPEGNCCTSKESKGAGCSIKPDPGECPNECSDQGRCVDGRCVCFPGFSGLDCSESNCPGNCNNRGRCVNGQCLCDPGFTGADCSSTACPDGCGAHGRCVDGRCVCDAGFSGPGCSDESCPGNCNKRGRCVNGRCVCNPGFAGPDCSTKACPDNCNDRGRCVNGKCVCDSGFSGADCSDKSCPGNCNNRGRCVNGQCVCNDGFTGEDCSDKSCPGNCNNRGRCVNGQCVCNDGFTGEDCSNKSCPGNCNNRGRCVNGQCVCNDGFTGEDCSDKSCPGNCNNRGRCVNGQCVCNDGFTGEDCSDKSCPGNCNNRGRCVNGQCVCNDGFTGEDCSDKSCPGNCNNRGRCVNGKCVCDSGFSGADCSDKSCPGNCNNRGRCVNGQCVCNDRFTGEDCSEKACPNSCSNRGKCVNGKCACAVGFSGPDCASRSCPNNCNSRGRCVKGACVCKRVFTGPDCSQCQDGRTGPNCDTVMSGVSQLSPRDITETSVTLVWTPPAVLYDTYHMTFSSQKESDHQIPVQVDGGLSSFTQTGLAAGQEYSVSMVGELDGRRGAEASTTFKTLIAGPSNLHVVKTTSTSAVVQWEESRAVIDRYLLTVTPSDGGGRSQEITIPFGQNSAHIQQLEAGRVYDVLLVAERSQSRSEPAATQVVPGVTLPGVTTAALTLQVTQARGLDGDSDPQFEHQGRKTEDLDSVRNKVPLTSKAKTLISKATAVNSTRLRVTGRPSLPGTPKATGLSRFSSVRGGPDGLPSPLKKGSAEGQKTGQVVPEQSKPGVLTVGASARDLIASSSDRRDDKTPAAAPENDSETNSQSSSEGPTASKEQPDVGTASHGNDTDPAAAEPTAPVGSQEKKCMNKMKVTHLRLPVKERDSRLRGGVTGLQGSTLNSDPAAPPSGDLDPLHKLLTDTFENLNVTTFSVHLSKASNLSHDENTVKKQLLDGLIPLSSFSSSSSQSSTAESSPSESPESSSPTTVAASPSPSSPSIPDNLESPGNHKLHVEDSKSKTDRKQPSLSGDRRVPFYRRTLPPKRGLERRPHPNFDSFQNRTNQNVRVAHRFPPRLNPDTQTESPTPLSGSEESSSREVVASVNYPSENKEGAEPSTPSGVKRNIMLTDRAQGPGRRPPPRGYPRQPSLHVAPRQNRTQPIRRPFSHPSRPLNPETETKKESLPVTSSPLISTGSLSSDTGPQTEENEGAIGGSVSVDFNQTLKEKLPPSHPPYRRSGFFRRPQPDNGSAQNHTSLRFPQRGPIRKPFPNTRLNVGNRSGPGGPLSQQGRDSLRKNPTGGQNVLRLTEQDSPTTIPNAEKDAPAANGRQPSNELEKETMAIKVQDRQTSGRLDPGFSKPVTPPEGHPPTKPIIGEHHTLTDEHNSGIRLETEEFSQKYNERINTTGSDTLNENLVPEENTGTTFEGGPTVDEPHSRALKPSRPDELRQKEDEESPTTNINIQPTTAGGGLTLKKENSIPSRQFTPPKRQPPTKPMTEEHDIQTGSHDTRVRPEKISLYTGGSEETTNRDGVNPRKNNGTTGKRRPRPNPPASRPSSPVRPINRKPPPRTGTGGHPSQVESHSSRVEPETTAGDLEDNEETISKETDDARENTGAVIRGPPTLKRPDSRPVTQLKRQPPTRVRAGEHHTSRGSHDTGSETSVVDATGSKETTTLDTDKETSPNNSVDVRQSTDTTVEEPNLKQFTPPERLPPTITRTPEHYTQTETQYAGVRSETRASDTGDSEGIIPEEKIDAGKNPGTGIKDKPKFEKPHSRPSRPVIPSKRQPPTSVRAGERHSQTVSQDARVRPEASQLAETTAASPDSSNQLTNGGTATGSVVRGRPTLKQTHSRASRPGPVTSPKRTTAGQLQTPMQRHVSPNRDHPDSNHTTKRPIHPKTAASPASDVSTHGVVREPLDYVGVTNRTSDGFTLVWDSPEGKYKNFVVTQKESDKNEGPSERKEDSVNVDAANKKHQPSKQRGTAHDYRVPEGSATEGPASPTGSASKPTKSDQGVKTVVPGSARSVQFQDLLPKTEYTLTLLGKGSGILSRLHKLVISTGPEPPTDIVFHKVTENSLTVSWTKPKSPVSGFKVTYTHAEEGEPVSVSLDSNNSSLELSQLTPGSSYEVAVVSTLGLDESDAVNDFVMTRPDPPTDLRAINVSDSSALLLWRPALAAVDKYSIVYGAGTDSELRITVSGNAAEHQLSGLEGSTTYTVTVTSRLGDLDSSPASTTFTTTSGGSGNDGGESLDLQASNVTPRTATLSWKRPSQPVDRYRLTYQTDGQEVKEILVDASLTQFNLSRLHPGASYSAQLQAERGGAATTETSTQFTTGSLRFPFPSDCSQELLNGIVSSGEVEIFPRGKLEASVTVYCDMETDGGGWTVFQRRKDGSEDFFRGWKDYVQGFGDVNGEFWLGLDSLHNMTSATPMTLRVDLRDASEAAFAQYSTFQVGRRNYKLTVGGYSGTAGDSFSYHNNRIFSTRDRDPSTFITRCAMSYRGGWWYKNCHEANLNGLYGISFRHQGVVWTSWKGKEFSIPFTEMKMRPTAFRPPARG